MTTHTHHSAGATMPIGLDEIRSTVQARYGATAQRVLDGAATPSSCCGPAESSSGCCGSTGDSWDPITSDLYEAGQTVGILLGYLACMHVVTFVVMLVVARKERR